MTAYSEQTPRLGRPAENGTPSPAAVATFEGALEGVCMGNGLEHLDAWRGIDTLTIWEAGSLIAGANPNYSFPQWSKMTEPQRERYADIKSWRDRLWNAAQGQGAGPKLVATITDRVEPRTFTDPDYRIQRAIPTKTPDPTKSTVRVEDLCTWLEAIGHRPAFFFPESADKGSTELPPERGHANESDELRWAILASSKWWKNVDRDDKTTHPDNDTVADWLRENHDFGPTAADRIATLVRPAWAAKGRPSQK